MNILGMDNLDAIDLLANIAQLASFQMNIEQVTNDVLLKRLDQQDQALSIQTNIYLKKIVEQNEEIIKILKERLNYGLSE